MVKNQLWKESYRIGIESIDEQHIQLFQMVDHLLEAINQNAGKEACQEAIAFLKKYVIKHFQDEETYQASIDYIGMKEHKKAHQDFTRTALEYERRLIESDYDIHNVKDLAGMLTAWLIYHVADADQKLAKGQPFQTISNHNTYSGNFTASVQDVLEKMAGLNPDEMHPHPVSDTIEGDILVWVGLIGDIHGNAIFAFTKEMAFNLLESMTFTRPDDIDDFVCSALSEFSNIASGNATIALSEKGIHCDITPPQIRVREGEPFSVSVKEGAYIDTGIGKMMIAIQSEQQ